MVENIRPGKSRRLLVAAGIATAMLEGVRVSFAKVAAPAIRFASHGFTVYPHMALLTRRYQDVIKSFPS
jgi:gamma-glutamyltranspeptidase